MIKRPIHRMRFTKSGYENLKKEYAELLSQRPAAVEDLRKAREMGDLKENGYYKASRQKLNAIDGRLVRVTYNLKTAKIVEDETTGIIGIGSTVILVNGDKETMYQFVGDLEADPSEKKLSLLSPIGKAVEGKKEGDIIGVQTPSGQASYVIKKVV
ncbi:MAG TPA: GreA/GreB family elongation factor [Candidatus Sulfotelmatobacter sp.]|jgi:transcription elongation factor GreA|nr:GreA/GreB family elongation factor [Candidatus Sulfotelmatobacter sp.]